MIIFISVVIIFIDIQTCEVDGKREKIECENEKQNSQALPGAVHVKLFAHSVFESFENGAVGQAAVRCGRQCGRDEKVAVGVVCVRVESAGEICRVVVAATVVGRGRVD